MTLSRVQDRYLTCAYCGEIKPHAAYPYPTTYAECWACVWRHHNEAEHPPKKRWKLRSPITRTSK